MKKKIPRRKNPMMSDKVNWMWALLLPIALVAWLFMEIVEDIRVSRIRKQRRKEHYRRIMYSGWGWWDDQGL